RGFALSCGGGRAHVEGSAGRPPSVKFYGTVRKRNTGNGRSCTTTNGSTPRTCGQRRTSVDRAPEIAVRSTELDHRRRPACPRSTTARVIGKVITTPATERTRRLTSTAGRHDTFPPLMT